MSKARKDFAYCKRWLRRSFPCSCSLRIHCVGKSTFDKHSRDVESIEGLDLDGVCICSLYENRPQSFIILIDKALSDKNKVGVLLHEYSHLLRYLLPDNIDYHLHDSVWVSIHSRLKRLWAEA